MSDFNANDSVAQSGGFLWLAFNVLGLITTDAFQMFSFAAGGISALCVGGYYLSKTLKLWKNEKDSDQ